MATIEPNFRPLRDADRAFLQRLYTVGRESELSRSGWTTEAIETFLGQQFDLQQRHYRAQYPDAEYWLIEQLGQPIGRLTLQWEEDALRILEVALLPEWRGRGLGSALLGRLITAAEALGLAVALHVEVHNPAQRLYRRLGFDVVGDSGVYLAMRRPVMRTGVTGDRQKVTFLFPWLPVPASVGQ